MFLSALRNPLAPGLHREGRGGSPGRSALPKLCPRPGSPFPQVPSTLPLSLWASAQMRLPQRGAHTPWKEHPWLRAPRAHLLVLPRAFCPDSL